MTRRAGVWFGRPSSAPPTTTTTTTARTPKAKSKYTERVELAVVFENIATSRPYKPGTGPRLRPISLIPARDTTAYIRDEFFVPHTLSRDGTKRLQYMVGWTDLPAARLVVDAERIADYVSPLAYEEWCAARADERDEEERRREEEENIRAVAEAEARESGVVLRNGAVKETRDKKTTGWKGGKRKRRTKAQMEEQAAARPATPMGDDDKKKRKHGRSRKSAPSLSTPSKARLEEFRDLETEAEPETEAPNDEEATSSQINGEHPSSVAEEGYDSGEASSVSTGLEPAAKKRRTKSPGPPLSRFPPGIETDSSRSTPVDSSRGATSSPALPPLPKPHTTSRPARSLAPPTFPSVPQASANDSSTPTAPAKKAAPVFPPMPHKRSLLSLRDPPSSPFLQPPPTSSKPQTPTPKKWHPPLNMKETAIEPPVNSTEMKSKPRTESAPAVIQPPQPTTTTSTPRTGFTPWGKGSTPWHASQAVKSASSLSPTRPFESIERAPAFSAPGPKSNPRRQDSPARGPIVAHQTDTDHDELAEDVYEVLCLEGLQVRHVRGKPVRYFAVRWKGNWPPGQNPTWEPEGNIPRYMVKRYLLANTTPRKGGVGTLDKYLTPSWSQRKFSSVSEAFEGGDPAAAPAAPEDDEAAEGDEDEEVEEGGEGDEMLLVTDEPPSIVKPTLSW